MEDFCACVHEGNYSVVFFSANNFICLFGGSASLKMTWEASSSSACFVGLCRTDVMFFLTTEFTSEAICTLRFLYVELFFYQLDFLY